MQLQKNSSGSYITNTTSKFRQKDQTAPSAISGTECCDEKQTSELNFQNLYYYNVSEASKSLVWFFLDPMVKLEQIIFICVKK